MVELRDKESCICKDNENRQSECVNRYTVRELGKSIKLLPKNSDEEVCLIIIDDCLIVDNNTKCDALFLYKSNSKKVSFLVELKGARDIPKAFRQLSFTRDSRAEYREIIEKFTMLDSKKTMEKFVIVSNGQLSKTAQERYENENHIRVVGVLHSEATTPIPNLRDYI